MAASVMIPISAMAVPVAIVGTVLITKHLARSRELAHIERMEAMRTGNPLHGGGHVWKAIACSAIGAGVPIASFFTVWLSNLTTRGSHEEAWVAACVVSLVAVVSGGRLARSLFSQTPLPPSTAYYHHEAAYAGKPHADPDLYDVAGRRG